MKIKSVWLPKIYQEDSADFRNDNPELEYVEMITKADHDVSEIRWMNIVSRITRQRDEAIAEAKRKLEER